MMPIKHIRIELVENPEHPLLEDVGARLEHHGLKIRVDNQFLSDVGDRWRCQITDIDNHEIVLEGFSPSLRGAMIKTLKAAEEVLCP